MNAGYRFEIARQDSGEQADAGCEREQSPVHDRQVAGPWHQVAAPVIHQHSQRAAEKREQDAFGQQLPDQSPKRGSKRQPDRYFL